MFYLVGIGLKPKQLTLEAIETLNGCDQIFLESYTSEYSEGLLAQLRDIIRKDFKKVGRVEVEEKMGSALASAKRNNVALMIFGNALTATTHIQLLLDAKELGVRAKVIPGISVTNTLAESGLDEYKFGRTATICFHSAGFEPETFYDQILKNQKAGLHTLCLLDIKKDEKPERLMNCREAIAVLKKISAKREKPAAFEYVALLGMASEKQKIVVGEKKIFETREVLDIFPQSLVVIGKLNDKEKEALEKLHA